MRFDIINSLFYCFDKTNLYRSIKTEKVKGEMLKNAFYIHFSLFTRFDSYCSKYYFLEFFVRMKFFIIEIVKNTIYSKQLMRTMRGKEKNEIYENFPSFCIVNRI